MRGWIRDLNQWPKGNMWSAILVALLCMCLIRNERKQGCGPKGDKVLFIYLFVCPSICLSPQALSDLKSALSGLKSALPGVESDGADFWPERADFRSNWADFRPGRADFRSERAWGD